MSSIGLNNFTANIQKSGYQLWLLTALVALVIPPAGILLILYLLFKGLKQVPLQQNLIIILWVAVFSVIGATGYYFIYTNLRDRQAYSIDYSRSDFVQHKVLGPNNGTGTSISFLRPKDFVSPEGASKTSSVTSEPILVRRPLGQEKYSISTIVTAAFLNPLTTGANPIPAFLDEVDKAMSGSSNPLYHLIKKDLQYYVQTVAIPDDYGVVISNNPKRLMTPNISKNAWIFDLSVNKIGDGGGYKDGQTVSQGEIALLYGKDTYYYFIIYSVKANWESNAETWQNIFNSIKIDQ